MNKERLEYLFHCYMSDSANEEELFELKSILNNPANEDDLKETIDNIYYKNTREILLNKTDLKGKEKSFQYIVSQPQDRKLIRLWPRFAAVASIIFILFVSTFYLLNKTLQNRKAAANITREISPGGIKATLTLSNGQTILLTKAKDGKIAQQGGVVINKVAGGQIVYKDKLAGMQQSKMQFNKMTTPPGGQYRLTLADGTLVWLNAASSISYPTAFVGKDREVEITGEAYFEVAHNRLKPFRVRSNGQIVEVLGTHFNINSYSDEPVTTTTLLEGSVKISTKVISAVLKPSQAAVIQKGELPISIREADIDQATAWKNGFFEFQNADIQMVMRELSRWYNVDIEYRGDIGPIKFSGEMERSLTASQILKLLNHTHLHFTIEEKKIIITPN